MFAVDILSGHFRSLYKPHVPSDFLPKFGFSNGLRAAAWFRRSGTWRSHLIFLEWQRMQTFSARLFLGCEASNGSHSLIVDAMPRSMPMTSTIL